MPFIYYEVVLSACEDIYIYLYFISGICDYSGKIVILLVAMYRQQVYILLINNLQMMTTNGTPLSKKTLNFGAENVKIRI